MRPILPLLTLLATLSPMAWARAPARELGLIKQGRGLGALRTLRPKLEQSPNDPHLNTLAGLAYAVEGRYGDALGHLERGNGTDLYPTAGLARQAEALRALGRGDEAASLHRERLLQPDLSEGAQLTAVVATIQDYRSVGALDQAWELVYFGMAIRPSEPRLLAFAAEVALDEGDLTRADAYIFLAERDESASPPQRLSMVQARRALAAQDPDLALAFLEESKQPRMSVPEAVGLRVAVLLALERPEDAMAVLSRVNLASREDPVLLAARARTELALGDLAAAEQTWAFLQRVAPGAPMFPEYVPGLSPTPELPK